MWVQVLDELRSQYPQPLPKPSPNVVATAALASRMGMVAQPLLGVLQVKGLTHVPVCTALLGEVQLQWPHAWGWQHSPCWGASDEIHVWHVGDVCL